VGFRGKARKGLGLLRVRAERHGGSAWGQAGGGAVACPPFIPKTTQPQEAYQQEVMDKEVVYHSVPFSVGKSMIDYLIRRLEPYPQDRGTRPRSEVLRNASAETTESGASPFLRIARGLSARI
jgi:hypothetical protein